MNKIKEKKKKQSKNIDEEMTEISHLIEYINRATERMFGRIKKNIKNLEKKRKK